MQVGNLNHGAFAQDHTVSRTMKQSGFIHEEIKELSTSEWVKSYSKPTPFRNCYQNEKQKFKVSGNSRIIKQQCERYMAEFYFLVLYVCVRP